MWRRGYRNLLRRSAPVLKRRSIALGWPCTRYQQTYPMVSWSFKNFIFLEKQKHSLLIIIIVGIYISLNLIKALSGHNLHVLLPWPFVHVFTCLTDMLPIIQLVLTFRLVTYTLNYQVPNCTCTHLDGERQAILYAVPTCIPWWPNLIGNRTHGHWPGVRRLNRSATTCSNLNDDSSLK